MEIVLDLIKIVLPASFVMYAMYLTVKAFLNKEFERKLVDLKIQNSSTVLPIRLQAYERICLFLERISLQNLLLRVNDPNLNAKQFQHKLLFEIREEFNHNISQQVYMSDMAWNHVKIAVEDILGIINGAAETVSPELRSLDLAIAIFDKQSQKEDTNLKALLYIKAEIRDSF